MDKSSVVASAALVSGIHLLDGNSEIVRRWTNEIQEALQSKVALVQFHALALLHRVRQSDRQAVSKLVTTLTRGTVRSPLAQCLLIRYTAQVMADMQPGPSGERPFYEYLDSCLRNKSEMVIFEAARAITEMKGVTTRELSPAITVLQLFLSSSKPVQRFAAVRTLNKVAMQHPLPVANCNMDLEGLITDPNRSIATLALTTLLKTGSTYSDPRREKNNTDMYVANVCGLRVDCRKREWSRPPPQTNHDIYVGYCRRIQSRRGRGDSVALLKVSGQIQDSDELFVQHTERGGRIRLQKGHCRLSLAAHS